LDFFARQVGDHLFVGHAQHHIAAGTVLKTAHLRIDLVPAPGLLPQLSRVNHRHGDLLPADGFHLFADDIFDAVIARRPGAGS
jgi:hypothetical protein